MSRKPINAGTNQAGILPWRLKRASPVLLKNNAPMTLEQVRNKLSATSGRAILAFNR